MFPSTTPVRNPFRFGFSALLLIVALAALILTGCGESSESGGDVVLATVGDTEILGSYYEDRVAKMEQSELPSDATGQVMDMSTLPAKEKFLGTLINKEVMAQTALNKGLDQTEQLVGGRNSLITYESDAVMWANEVVVPDDAFSEEEVRAFYDKTGVSRTCRFIIADFADQAAAAREMAVSGADWMDIVAKYHNGDTTTEEKFELEVPYGRYNAEFDEGIFGVEVGGVTAPIASIYGYWVLKVVSEEPRDRPEFADAKGRIRDVLKGRVILDLRTKFKSGVQEKHNFYLEEDALIKAFRGLPAHEPMFYEGTKDPIKKEDLAGLEIDAADLEAPFYGYTDDHGVAVTYTLGDYKAYFDELSVFARPKKEQMLGGMRNKITEDIDKVLLGYEAKALGYHEHEDVLSSVGAKMEEMMVNKLYQDEVVNSAEITQAELDAFWADHASDYFVPITRTGRFVICATQASAEQAEAAAREGVAWREILIEHGTDKDNKSRSGKLENIRIDAKGSIRDALFALEAGEVSPVFAIENGAYGVVRLESVHEAYQIELATILDNVIQRMKQLREETAFLAALAAWKDELEIVTYPDNLAGMRSWHELTTAASAQ